MYSYSNHFSSHPVVPVVCSSYWVPYPQYTAPLMFVPNAIPHSKDECCISKAEVEFKSLNRLLWEQHVNWTRMTIMSIVFNLPELQFVEERLLRNATDMGNCLRPFYGDQIADRYDELIKEHLCASGRIGNGSRKRRYEKGGRKREGMV